MSVSAKRIRSLSRRLGERRSKESFRAAYKALRDCEVVAREALKNSVAEGLLAQDRLKWLALAVEAIEGAVDRIGLEVGVPTFYTTGSVAPPKPGAEPGSAP
jgi:hypothetical protein